MVAIVPKTGHKEHNTVTTLHPGADAAGSFTSSADGPIRTGRSLYRCIAIVTAIIMLIGGLAFTSPVAHAQSTSTQVIADLNARPELGSYVDLAAVSETHLLVGAAGSGTFNAQVSPGLVNLLVAVLLDLVAVAQADNRVAVAAPAEADGIVGIIYAAADAYGQPREDMLRVAGCESNLNPNAVNGSSGASGLFQFMPGTWATTPYADQDIFDPVANANAAAWMWDNGRRNEWTCQ